MSFVDSYLPYFKQELITCPLLALLPFQSLFTESLHKDQLLALPPCPVLSEHPTPHATCSISVPCLFIYLFFLQGRGQSIQGAKLVYPRDSCGDTMFHLFAHLLVCISQAGLEPTSDSTGALLFSQYNVVWRSFVQARGSGCQGSDSSWWFFFSAKYGSSISAKFLIYGAHTVCFCPLVPILDPPSIHLIYNKVQFFLNSICALVCILFNRDYQ
jgi:hypothetical protein